MSRITDVLNTGKKKAAAVVLGGLTVASLGGLTAFAAGNLTSITGKLNDNGTMEYSTDDGKTWSSTLPKGVSEGDVKAFSSKDGDVTSVGIGNTGNTDNVDLPDNGEVEDTAQVEVKNENGKTLYSIDGGKTWSEEVDYNSLLR